MRSTRLSVGAVLMAAGVFCSVHVALAHHSGAMFDEVRVIELHGTVKQLQWANPHVWLQVTVEENGATKEWSIEGGSPNTLSRNGWRSTTFKPGDVVTVKINPMKDGTPGGLFVAAKFAADGRTIGRWE